MPYQSTLSQVRTLPRNRVSRGFAAALAVVALAGQLSSFAHLVLVRHVTCAEHGDMIEVGRERVIAAAATERAAEDSVAAASPAESHGHEHCLVAPMRRDRLASRAGAVLDSSHIDAYGTIGVARSETIAPAIAVLVLAPKNSPPQA